MVGSGGQIFSGKCAIETIGNVGVFVEKEGAGFEPETARAGGSWARGCKGCYCLNMGTCHVFSFFIAAWSPCIVYVRGPSFCCFSS